MARFDRRAPAGSWQLVAEPKGQFNWDVPQLAVRQPSSTCERSTRSESDSCSPGDTSAPRLADEQATRQRFGLPSRNPHVLIILGHGRLLRVFAGETPVALHARVKPGEYAPEPGASKGPSSSQRAFLLNLLARCERVGAPLKAWAEAAHEERGVRALRLIQGVLALVRKHPREIVLAAANTALTHRVFRYKDLRRLAETAATQPKQRSLLDVHESIRPMADYRLEKL